MRKYQRAAMVLVLASCGAAFGPAAAAQRPSRAGGQELAPAPADAATKQKKTRKTKSQTLKFELGEGPAYAGVIDEIDSAGLIATIPNEQFGQIMPVAALTEGWYLGLVTSALPGGNSMPPDARVLLAEVKRVVEGGRLEVQVAAEAYKQLDADQFIFLLRPRGSTTEQMKAIPPIARLESADGATGDGLPGADAASLLQSQNNLKQIGLALHNFHDVYQSFPPAVIYGPDGKPWHSWRVLILPYIEQQQIFDRYRWDEPWDGPNNSKLLQAVPSVYRDPVYGESDDTYTHYAAVTGKDTCFGSEGVRLAQATENWSQALANPQARLSFARIVDGTSNTLMVGPLGPKRKVPWMKPEDIVVGENAPGLGKEGRFAAPYKTAKGHAGAFLFCDGSVTTILDNIEPDSLRKLLAINDGQVIQENEIPTLGPGRYSPPTRPEIHIVRDGAKVSARWVLAPVAEHDHEHDHEGLALPPAAERVPTRSAPPTQEAPKR